MTMNFFKMALSYLPLNIDKIVQAAQEGQSLGQSFVQIFLFWTNILLGCAFGMLLIMTVTASGNGEEKNKRVANWMFMLGFAAVGLFILRKAFFS